MEDFRFEMILLKDNIDVLMSCITQIDMASMRILKKAKNHLVGYFVLLLFGGGRVSSIKLWVFKKNRNVKHLNDGG